MRLMAPKMVMRSVPSRLRGLLRRFGGDRKGNVAITFALATLPMVGFVGSAIDYSHANSVKVALQAALDSTALMLSKDAATASAADLNAKAQTYFKALFTRPEGTNVSIKATYASAGGSSVVVNGSADVPTIFMEVFGYNSISVTGSSTTRWGTSRLRVALALDNTGSMAWDGKMTALKSATKSLLTQLKSAATSNGDVYVSIIPFSKDVNMGASYYSASSIDWTDWDAANGAWVTAPTCSNGKKKPKKKDDDDDDKKSKKGKGGCSKDYVWKPADHSTWNGCITDRGKIPPGSNAGYDQTVDPPTPSIKDTLFPAEQYSYCPVPMMGLNYNWTAMNSLIDAMQPAGSTNQPIGLVWAWQSLVGGGPLTAPAKTGDYVYQDIIILLSDGLNTQDRWYSQQTPVDNRMYQTGNGKGTCANIKASGVTVYTLQVNTGGDPTSKLLQNCASSSDKFYLLTKASDISNAFTAIGTDLTKLRVAK